MRISDILRNKGDAVVTVTPGDSVRHLLAMLAEHNVGALVVSHDGAGVDGIVSERDVVRQMHHDPDVLDATVSSIMTVDVRTCATDEPVDELAVLMTERRIRHVPVVRDDQLVGVVSIGDVVKSRIGQLEFEKEQLEGYISHAG